MSTKRALSHLQALIELDERAKRKIKALSATLKQVNEQVDAILHDDDYDMEETLSHDFRLSKGPVVGGSLVLMVNGTVVKVDKYNLDGAQITPLFEVPEKATVVAKYLVAGLRTQTLLILEKMDDLDASYFTNQKALYNKAINWIKENM